MDDPKAFDAFRDSSPDWHRLAPIEIAIMFWNGGYEEGRQYGYESGHNDAQSET